MFIFPLINFIFLIILYVVHKKVFWVTLVLEIFIYAGGIFYIYQNFGLVANQMLYMFTLTGIGFIVVLIAFFVAIFINHQSES
ncbi:hypothetical protein HOO68_04550 [Candidatus Gracilibacteria bacterium]|nr:hypothetical protein [Candidatus Gracilibacteria bacterium]